MGNTTFLTGKAIAECCRGFEKFSYNFQQIKSIPVILNTAEKIIVLFGYFI